MPTTLANVVSKSSTGRPMPVSVPSAPVNVADTERLLSLAGGGLLAAFGLGQKGLAQILLPLVGGALAYRGLSGHCSAYQALGVSTATGSGGQKGGRAPATAVEAGHGTKVEEVMTINKPAGELYSFWRKFENLPKFMAHLVDVKEHDAKKSHWKAKGPLGTAVEWDAEVITETPGQLIAWKSLPGADVDSAGAVHFTPAPAGRGTEVRVTLKYDPPGGKVGAAVATLFGESPSVQVRGDLRRFKALMETGEIPTIDGQPMGR